MRKRDSLAASSFSDVFREERLDDPQFMTALARGLDVLGTFDPSEGPLGNGEIAAKVGLPKPTISRITHTLSACGYLSLNPDNGKYALGAAVLSLGFSFLDSMVIRQVSRSILSELAMETDSMVALGMRDRLSIAILETARGPGERAIRLDVGTRLPIHSSAMGFAYLTGLSDTELGFMKTALSKKIPEEMDKFATNLERANKEMTTMGFCISQSFHARGYNSAAINWRAPHGKGNFVLSITGTENIFPRERLIEEVGPRLLVAKDNIQDDWLTLVEVG